MIERIKVTEKVEALFEGWEETMIWSCLQDVMGEVYGDNGEHIKAAKAVLGDFCFFSGEVDKNLIRHEMERTKGASVLVPRNRAWEMAMEEEGERSEQEGIALWKKGIRYALKKERDVFSKEKLEQAICALKTPFHISPLNEAEFLYSRENGWCRDWTSQFSDYEQYKEMGLGFVVYHGEHIVSGASSYTRYREGIEIQIDTKKEFQNQGLAYACAAQLILECQERGLYPSWDAHNKKSLSLAEKLGYHFSHEYPVFERSKIVQ